MLITSCTVHDLRFPTSLQLDGSDAMNPDPDYSAAYLRLHTPDPALVGHGFVFTIGRGNDVQAAAVNHVAQRLVGRAVDDVCGNPAALNRELLWDSQLRWLGPDKGVMHMAVGAVMNAVWDLRARSEGLPLWAVLDAFTPSEVVDLVDWTYLTDFMNPAQGREILEEQVAGRPQRRATLSVDGLAAYTTSPGWLGYDDDKLVRLSREAVDQGFRLIKLKVGVDVADDRRRLGIARSTVGADIELAVDANQRWTVNEAIENVKRLAEFDLRWVEEPTHPDDVVGHSRIRREIAPTPVATGEHLANPVMAKQLFQMQAIDILQIDATRVAGVHDLLAMMLLAAGADVSVIPHAGGVGLCEAVQHFGFFNAIAIAADPAPLAIEYVDHLHEHMADPVVVDNGVYQLPGVSGASTAFNDEAITRFAYPSGTEWSS